MVSRIDTFRTLKLCLIYLINYTLGRCDDTSARKHNLKTKRNAHSAQRGVRRHAPATVGKDKLFNHKIKDKQLERSIKASDNISAVIL